MGPKTPSRGEVKKGESPGKTGREGNEPNWKVDPEKVLRGADGVRRKLQGRGRLGTYNKMGEGEFHMPLGQRGRNGQLGGGGGGGSGLGKKNGMVLEGDPLSLDQRRESFYRQIWDHIAIGSSRIGLKD